jgi:hypothetical protein
MLWLRSLLARFEGITPSPLGSVVSACYERESTKIFGFKELIGELIGKIFQKRDLAPDAFAC